MDAKQVYNTVVEVFDDLDTIYEDYLIYLVGFEGLYTLQENHLIKGCDVVNGRQVYALCEFKDN